MSDIRLTIYSRINLYLYQLQKYFGLLMIIVIRISIIVINLK